MSRRRAAALVAAVVMTACAERGPLEPSDTGAAPSSWEPPRQLGTAAVGLPDVVVAPDGRAAVLWLARPTDVNSGDPYVSLVRRLADGTWTPVQQPGQSYYKPDMTVMRDGTVQAVWVDRFTGLTVASFGPGSSSAPPRTLSAIRYDTSRLSYPAAGIAAHANGALSILWPTSAGLDAGRWTKGGWSGAFRVSAEAPHSWPQLAVDGFGNEVAAWSKNGELRISRRAAGGAWTAETPVATMSWSDAVYELGVDGAGCAFLAWRDDVGPRSVQWVARLEPGRPAQLERLAEHPLHRVSPRLAVAPDGTAVVVWAAHAGAASRIHARRYVPGRGWQGDELVGLDRTGNESWPAVATNAQGGLIVAWRQEDLTRTRLWSRASSDGAWGAAVRIPNDDGREVTSLHIGLDDRGGATAVWRHDGDVWASRREGGPAASSPTPEPTAVFVTPPVGDGGPVRYENGTAVPGGRPQLVSLDDGRPLLVWISEEPGGTRVWASRVRNNDTWPPGQAAPSDLPGTCVRFDVVRDEAGGAFVLALQDEAGEHTLWSLSIDDAGRPGAPASVDIGPGRSYSYAVGRDERGAPLLAWARRRDGVWIRRYDSGRWGADERVAEDTTGTGVSTVRVVSNGGGDLRVLWVQDLSSRHPHAMLSGARWTGAGWTEGVSLSGVGWWISDVETAAGVSGDAVATWATFVGGPPGLRGGAYAARGSEWVCPDGPVVHHATTLAGMGVDARGGVVALWRRPDGDSTQIDAPAGLWASRRSSAGWTALERIETHDGPLVPLSPQLAVSNDGAALAAWRATGRLWINHKTPEHAWGTPRPLDAARGDLLAHHVAAVGESGWVAWSAYDGARIGVWAMRVALR